MGPYTSKNKQVEYKCLLFSEFLSVQYCLKGFLSIRYYYLTPLINCIFNAYILLSLKAIDVYFCCSCASEATSGTDE